jgi:hypothetical protein
LIIFLMGFTPYSDADVSEVHAATIFRIEFLPHTGSNMQLRHPPLDWIWYYGARKSLVRKHIHFYPEDRGSMCLQNVGNAPLIFRLCV